MRTSRRLATIACGVIGTGALVVGTAGIAGADARAYDGKATAEALTISLLGQTLTTSAASAELQNDHGKASATEAVLQGSTATAEQTGAGTNEQKASGCNTALAQIPVFNRADITCGSATVTINPGGTGFARGIGSEITLEPSVANLLGTLQLQEPVQGAAGQVFEQLIDPLVQNLTGTPVGEQVDAATATVQDVLDNVLKLKATARVVVAPALAEVTNSGTKLVSHAKAQGVRIELLPSDDSLSSIFPDVTAGEPLVTITIGSAEATKTVGDGPTKGDAQTPLVTVHFGSTKLLDALGLSNTQQDITVPGGQSFCLGLPEPLDSCITVAAASVDADGNAVADGATVELFKGLQGGIRVATGRATSGGSLTASAAAAPAIPADLPRTGGNAMLPLLGGGLLALAAATRRFGLARR
jgi:hypothetical protein